MFHDGESIKCHVTSGPWGVASERKRGREGKREKRREGERERKMASRREGAMEKGRRREEEMKRQVSRGEM